MSGAERRKHWWEVPGHDWLQGGGFASLKIYREFEGLSRLARNPMQDMMLRIQKDQKDWLKSLNDAVSPLTQMAKVFPDFNQEALANLQREMCLAMEVTRESRFGNSIPSIMGEQQRWKSLHLGLGADQWVDSLAKAQKQWSQLADLAGLSSRRREDAFAPFFALQRNMVAAGIQLEGIVSGEELGAVENPGPPTSNEIQRRIDETFEKQLAPVLAELKELVLEANSSRKKQKKSKVSKPMRLFWILFQILDGWYLTRFGKQENHPDLVLTPERTQQLRESMEFIIAVGHQIMGSERIVLRDSPLRKTPNGPLLRHAIASGQIVQVLEERHEWIAIGYEFKGEWVSGWVQKKYTKRISPRGAPGSRGAGMAEK